MLIFVLALLPVLGLVPFDFQSYSTVADHYLYIAMLGIAIAVAALLSRFESPRALAIGVVLAIVLAVAAHMQSWHWTDSQLLFQHTLRVNPGSVAANVNLAIVRLRQAEKAMADGRVEDAMDLNNHAIRLCQRALAMKPDDADARQTLVERYTTRGSMLARYYQDYAGAVAAYDRALKLDPNYALTIKARAAAKRLMNR